MKVLDLDQKAASSTSCILRPWAHAKEVATLRRSWPLGIAVGSAFFIIRQSHRAILAAFSGFKDFGSMNTLSESEVGRAVSQAFRLVTGHRG